LDTFAISSNSSQKPPKTIFFQIFPFFLRKIFYVTGYVAFPKISLPKLLHEARLARICRISRFILSTKEFIMKTNRFLLAVVLTALALIFFACSSGDDFNGNTGGGSSNSSGGSSSNCDPNATVTIGSQTWLKCNLNVIHNNGNGNSWCYVGTDYTSPNDKLSGTQGCAKYGRLYDWAAAMNLPSKCNTSSSNPERFDYDYDSDCALSLNHRGLCPQNFHIPTYSDWTELLWFVDSENDGVDSGPLNYRYSNAGIYLKSVSGWLGENNIDKYNFSAMPGGSGGSGFFLSAGSVGHWWSASEYGGSTYARYLHMENKGIYAIVQDGSKSSGLSVRCIKD
jgi:uncharacterized protein (TIGR02145 family)